MIKNINGFIIDERSLILSDNSNINKIDLKDIYFRKLYEYIKIRRSFDLKFKSLHILPTYFCNSYCSYCYNDIYKSNKKYIDISEFENKISDIFCNYKQSFNNIETIRFFGGEPLVDINKFVDLVERCISIFSKLKLLHISTGLGISKSNFDLFLDFIKNTNKQYDFKIRINPTYDFGLSYFSRPSIFYDEKEYLNRIKELINVKNDKLEVVLNTFLQKDTNAEIFVNDLKEFLNAFDIDLIRISYIINNKDIIDNRNLLCFFKNIYKLFSNFPYFYGNKIVFRHRYDQNLTVLNKHDFYDLYFPPLGCSLFYELITINANYEIIGCQYLTDNINELNKNIYYDYINNFNDRCLDCKYILSCRGDCLPRMVDSSYFNFSNQYCNFNRFSLYMFFKFYDFNKIIGEKEYV